MLKFKILFTFILLSLCISSVYAGSGELYHTVALGTEGYPEIEGISYKSSDFLGEDTNMLLTSPIGYFVDFDIMRRIPMVADRVYAPPGTIVDLIYIYSGQGVNISDIYFNLSKNIKEQGNLVEVLNIQDTSEGNIQYQYGGLNLTRSGIYKEYAINLTNASDAFVLDKLEVKNPLSVESVDIFENEEGGLDFKIYIQNNSGEYLNNIVFKYLEHEETFSIPALQEHVVSFSLIYPSEELGSFSIYNPNVKEECAVLGTGYYNINESNAVSVLAKNNGEIIPGAYIQPSVESICVRRIPYTMTYSELNISPSVPIDEEVNVERGANVEEASGEVLGITDTSQRVLPNTRKYSYLPICLLVVDVLLWYSWSIYESKYNNSRLCAKGSQNVGQRRI